MRSEKSLFLLIEFTLVLAVILLLCECAEAKRYRNVDDLLNSYGVSRNFALEDVRIAFVEGLSPGISEGAYSPSLLFTKEKWECIKHPAFTSMAFDGSIDNNTRELKFNVKRGFISDSDGFRYGYRNGLEFIGNRSSAEFLRSVRYEYYCDAYPDCTVDNSTGVNLVIEESKRGEGLLSYVARFLNGVNEEDAVAALLRNKTTRALNRRTYDDCEKNALVNGCELATSYYVCFE